MANMILAAPWDRTLCLAPNMAAANIPRRQNAGTLIWIVEHPITNLQPAGLASLHDAPFRLRSLAYTKWFEIGTTSLLLTDTRPQPSFARGTSESADVGLFGPG